MGGRLHILPKSLVTSLLETTGRRPTNSHAKDVTKLQKCFKFLVKSRQDAEGRLQSDSSRKLCVGLKAEERYLNKLLDNQHRTGVQHPVRG